MDEAIHRAARANPVQGVDSIDHGHYLDEEQAHKMKAKGIYLVPTFGPTHYYVHKRQAEPWRIARAEQVEPIHAAAFKLALDLGVPIALGYFAVSFSLGIAARSAGLTPIQGFIASLFNNASAGEYAAFSLIAAGAA